ncbi:MAG: hypothetical protein MJZ41_10115 [Bacteroidaceae bacterium]|nr:hypothetical protein [Bacteroidaceae bacterium]
MIFEIHTKDTITTADINAIAASCSNIINIGKQSKQVWNAIALDDESVDSFQCHLIGAGDAFRLIHGQERTECPKGLMSSKLIPCNGCMGRCVNIHAGRPKYYQRNPETPTLLNGKPVAEYGSYISKGDVISLGEVTINVR